MALPRFLISATRILVEYLDAAKVMAQLFSSIPGTTAVGLFGSLARKQNPDSIDLIVFSDTIFGQMRYDRYGGYCPVCLEKEEDLRALNLLAADFRILRILALAYQKRHDITFNVCIMPDRPGPELLSKLDDDPDSLDTLTKEILFWDGKKDQFLKNDAKLRWLLEPTGVCEIEVISGNQRPGEGSALIIRDDDGQAIGLDCGCSTTNGHSYDLAGKIAAAYSKQSLGHLCISHFHADHYGLMSEVLRRLTDSKIQLPIIVATELTARLLSQRLYNTLPTLLDHLRFQTSTARIRLVTTRHSVPGSAAIFYQGQRTILYTSDFYAIDLPGNMPAVDLMIVDATNANKESPREENGEQEARENIRRLMAEVNQPNHGNVYIAMFSTQLERAAWLYWQTKELTGDFPFVNGGNLLSRLKTFINWEDATDGPITSNPQSPVVLLTGAWAQGIDDSDSSALVKLAQRKDFNSRIQPNDTVILSCRIPVWSNTIADQIKLMCTLLKGQGARIVVDESAPDSWLEFAEKQKVHIGGHGNLPELMAAIQAVRPGLVMPFHADYQSRQRLARACQENGLEVLNEGRPLNNGQPYIVSL